MVPSHTDKFRVYDQLFIDGTYFHKKCLFVACTAEHPVAWLWCTGESKYNYTRLLDMLAPPLIVTIDGSGGARAVIKKHWPDTKIRDVSFMFSAISSPTSHVIPAIQRIKHCARSRISSHISKLKMKHASSSLESTRPA